MKNLIFFASFLICSVSFAQIVVQVRLQNGQWANSFNPPVLPPAPYTDNATLNQILSNHSCTLIGGGSLASSGGTYIFSGETNPILMLDVTTNTTQLATLLTDLRNYSTFVANAAAVPGPFQLSQYFVDRLVLRL